MTKEELETLISNRGYPCSVRKEEVVVDTCLYCGNASRNLELNASLGVYHCWACGNGGRLQDFIRDFLGISVRIEVSSLVGQGTGKRPETALTKGPIIGEPASRFPSAVRYLRTRGFTISDFILYGFRVATNDKDEEQRRFYARLIIPVRDFWSQESAGFVARGYVGEQPKYLAECSSACVGYRVSQRTAPYVATEGIFDGISAHRAGANAAVFLGRTPGPEFEEWVSRIPPGSPPVILLDGDAQEQGVRLWWRARAIRTDVVQVPLPAHLDPAKVDPRVLKQLIEIHISKRAERTLSIAATAPVARSRITFTGE